MDKKNDKAVRVQPALRTYNVLTSVSRCALVFLLSSATPLVAQTGGDAARGRGDQPPTVAALFSDFLHFSVLGRFDVADTQAQQLLNHSDLDPVELLRLSEEQERGIETLIVLINNSTISQSASRVLEVIREGEHLRRQNSDRILTNIAKLGGDPQTEHNAIQRLVDSGEYAVPWMIQTLRDPEKESLWPRVVRALPRIGKAGVMPLVEALRIDDDNIRRTVIQTLGQIGYAQAIPYLQALIVGVDGTPESKAAAVEAIARIEGGIGRTFGDAAANEFFRLSEQFYQEHGSVRADERLPRANVWYWNDQTQFLDAVVVPQPIFGSVMAMRCCDLASSLNPEHTEAMALWLAANIRRESRLGMNVESGDPSETGETDASRPANFPRALYFTSAAGPRYAHLVLWRAVHDRDAQVALGAIAALRRVGGASSLIGSEGFKQPLVQALSFSDPVVRIRAALALGHALPRSSFDGVKRVVPVLDDALTQTGRRNILVVDPDQANLNRIMNSLRDSDTNVIGEQNVFRGLKRVRDELGSLGAIFLSTDVSAPEAADALSFIRQTYEIASTPVVLMVKADQGAVADQIVRADNGVEAVDASVGKDELLDRLSRVSARLGRTPFGADVALPLALESARTLQRIALNGDTVLDAGVAERGLVAALAASNEELQMASIDVLALLDSTGAQRAVADVALTARNTESVRIAAFEGLAESAKRFGHQLDERQTDELLTISFDEADLRMRTAASRALGALNLAADKASRITLKYQRP